MVPAECTRCGSCCFSESDRHARVTGDDYERLGEDANDAASLVLWIGNQAFLRITGAPGRCIGLLVEDGRFLCTIYARRPAVCRDLERGSPGCAGERDAKDARVQALLGSLIRLA